MTQYSRPVLLITTLTTTYIMDNFTTAHQQLIFSGIPPLFLFALLQPPTSEDRSETMRDHSLEQSISAHHSLVTPSPQPRLESLHFVICCRIPSLAHLSPTVLCIAASAHIQ